MGGGGGIIEVAWDIVLGRRIDELLQHLKHKGATTVNTQTSCGRGGRTFSSFRRLGRRSSSGAWTQMYSHSSS
jgi:hypothetical protein